MTQLELLPSQATLEASREMLAQNEYLGRIAIMGLNTIGNKALQAYALMSTSEDSRDRIFVEEAEGIRTTSPTKTPEQMAATPNSELIYYRAMNSRVGVHVVSNGAQTDPVLDTILQNHTLDFAVRTAAIVEIEGDDKEDIDLSCYEPDAPNYTPRITGVVDLNPNARSPFALAVVRKTPDVLRPTYSIYGIDDLEDLQPGVGYGIQTYNGNGSPLPSFDQSPYAIDMGEGVEDTAHALWDLLNKDNRVAVVVKSIDLERNITDHHIINVHQQ